MMIQRVGIQSTQSNKSQNNRPAFCATGKILDELGLPLVDISGKDRVKLLFDVIEKIAGKDDLVRVDLEPIEHVYSAGYDLKRQYATITSYIKTRKGFKLEKKKIQAGLLEQGPNYYFPKIMEHLEELAKQYPQQKSFFRSVVEKFSLKSRGAS